MPQLVYLLTAFRTGKLTLVELMNGIHQLVAEHRADTDELMAALRAEHAKAPLPAAAFEALTQRLRTMKDQTLIRRLARPQPALITTGDDTHTVYMDADSDRDDDVPSAAADVPADVAHIASGTLLSDRFGLTDLLGQGGMSRVYKAVDLRKVEAGASDPHVAVKVLTIPFEDYTDAMAVLQRETDNLRELTHPNIVRVIDCDRDGDTVFMTMEYLPGKPLADLLRTPHFAGFRREEAARIIADIASALEFAHDRHVVHGDLKPGNVMITENGGAKVIDFGIARLIAQPVGALVRKASHRSEAITGLTPAYASPEMLEGEAPDPRDDVYGLACMAWEIMTGAHPFDRRMATFARDQALRLTQPEKLSRGEYRALLRALAFDRAKRTPSVHQFMDEFLGRRARRLLRWSAAAGVAALAIGALSVLILNRAPDVAVSPVALQQTTAGPPSRQIGEVFRDCPTCPLMVVLPPTNSSAAKQIAYPLAIAEYEVTVGEFAEFVEASQPVLEGCERYDGEWTVDPQVSWLDATELQTPVHPVSCVSWNDANAYAAWLSQRTKQRYRLPTGAEWEHAALAGSANLRPWQDETDACANANVADQSAAKRYPGWIVHPCNDAHVHAAPVGSFAANAFGLHDMLGNVFEWVADCWREESLADAAVIASTASPNASPCSQRELRGGSWFTQPQLVNAAFRNQFDSDHRSTSIGFRIVREPQS
jgi:formylglycine-generating enzyme required for sulfatase activity/serine/threonine protein kinase